MPKVKKSPKKKRKQNDSISENTGFFSSASSDRIRIFIEVWGALYRSVKKTWPGYEDRIDENTIPQDEPLKADEGGWAICLRRFEKDLQQPSKISKVYGHKERYVDQTISLKLDDSAVFFRDEIVKILER